MGKRRVRDAESDRRYPIASRILLLRMILSENRFPLFGIMR